MLTKLYRQIESDGTFIKFLSLVRQNDFSSHDGFAVDFIKRRSTQEDSIPAHVLRLFTTRKEVVKYNTERTTETFGEAFEFQSEDVGPSEVLQDTGLIQKLVLKPGVPVLLTANLNVATGWVNGTQCEVLAIEEEEKVLHLRRIRDGQLKMVTMVTREIYRTSYSRTQFPVLVAFAATIHKVQSLTIDGGVCVSLRFPFKSSGQFYVACSRVRGGDKLFFTMSNLGRLTIDIDEHVETYLAELAKLNPMLWSGSHMLYLLNKKDTLSIKQ